MYCPLKEAELDVEICPVRCMYRRADGTCAYNELAFDEGLTAEEIAEVLQLPVEEVQQRADKAKRRIKTAMVVDAYLGFVNRGIINLNAGKDEHPVLRLFNLPKERLRAVLNRERYEKWREVAKVEVPFEDIRDLFLTSLAKGT